MIARDFPLNHLVSQTVEITKIGMFMTVFSRSTTERLAMRMFGNVRSDLKRAITVKTEPLPSTVLKP